MNIIKRRRNRKGTLSERIFLESERSILGRLVFSQIIVKKMKKEITYYVKGSRSTCS